MVFIFVLEFLNLWISFISKTWKEKKTKKKLCYLTIHLSVNLIVYISVFFVQNMDLIYLFTFVRSLSHLDTSEPSLNFVFCCWVKKKIFLFLLGILLLCRDTVGVFYSSTRLGWLVLLFTDLSLVWHNITIMGYFVNIWIHFTSK